jgi:hypothetical protein
MHVAAVGTGHFQHCFPGRAQTLRVCLDAGRCLPIGFWASEEEKWDHRHSPQGSSPPSLSVMVELYILRRQHVKLGQCGFN